MLWSGDRWPVLRRCLEWRRRKDDVSFGRVQPQPLDERARLRGRSTVRDDLLAVARELDHLHPLDDLLGRDVVEYRGRHRVEMVAVLSYDREALVVVAVAPLVAVKPSDALYICRRRREARPGVSPGAVAWLGNTARSGCSKRGASVSALSERSREGRARFEREGMIRHLERLFARCQSAVARATAHRSSVGRLLTLIRGSDWPPKTTRAQRQASRLDRW